MAIKFFYLFSGNDTIELVFPDLDVIRPLKIIVNQFNVISVSRLRNQVHMIWKKDFKLVQRRMKIYNNWHTFAYEVTKGYEALNGDLYNKQSEIAFTIYNVILRDKDLLPIPKKYPLRILAFPH